MKNPCKRILNIHGARTGTTVPLQTLGTSGEPPRHLIAINMRDYRSSDVNFLLLLVFLPGYRSPGGIEESSVTVDVGASNLSAMQHLGDHRVQE